MSANQNEFTLEQMDEEVSKMTRYRLLDESSAKFEKTEGGFISLTLGNEFYERVQLVRLFPFTDPDHYISIRTMEDSAREIGVVEDMNRLKKTTRNMFLEQLNLTYFTPVIQKILGVKDEYGYAYFHVMTDRGECRFAINMSANAVVRLSDTRLLITDLDENRFEIPDVLALSQKEQKKLDLFL